MPPDSVLPELLQLQQDPGLYCNITFISSKLPILTNRCSGLTVWLPPVITTLPARRSTQAIRSCAVVNTMPAGIIVLCNFEFIPARSRWMTGSFHIPRIRRPGASIQYEVQFNHKILSNFFFVGFNMWQRAATNIHRSCQPSLGIAPGFSQFFNLWSTFHK